MAVAILTLNPVFASGSFGILRLFWRFSLFVCYDDATCCNSLLMVSEIFLMYSSVNRFTA